MRAKRKKATVPSPSNLVRAGTAMTLATDTLHELENLCHQPDLPLVAIGNYVEDAHFHLGEALQLLGRKVQP